MFKFLLHFLFLVAGIAYLARRSARFYWTTLDGLPRRLRRQRGLRDRPARHRRGARHQPRPVAALADHRRREPDQHLRRDRGRERLPAERAHGRPEPSRDRARDPPARAAADLPAARARTPAARAARARARVPARGRARDAVALRAARARRRPARARGAVPAQAALAPAARCRSGAVAATLAIVLAARWQFFEQVLRSRIDTSANGTSTHLDVYGFIPDVLSSNPLFGLGLNNFSVYYEFVTGRTNFGPHSFYVATLVETGVLGTALFVAFLVYVFKRLGTAARDRPRARLAADPAAGVGDDGRAGRHDRLERLLPDDVVLLLLRVRDARAGGADRLRRRLDGAVTSGGAGFAGAGADIAPP